MTADALQSQLSAAEEESLTAVKLGMLATAELVEVVDLRCDGESLHEFSGPRSPGAGSVRNRLCTRLNPCVFAGSGARAEFQRSRRQQIDFESASHPSGSSDLPLAPWTSPSKDAAPMLGSR